MRVVKKPEERKAEMVAAAAKLFAQQGFVRTSVSEIVSAVDVAKGLFYYYFTTKDDMVKAVVEGYCSYLGTLAEQIADGEGTAREKFARLMHPEVWHECFTAPLTADLCLPRPRVCAHGPRAGKDDGAGAPRERARRKGRQAPDRRCALWYSDDSAPGRNDARRRDEHDRAGARPQCFGSLTPLSVRV